MATLKDVAKYAGVSNGTVSNVLNNVSSVSIENVQKVKVAMKALGYTPRSSARNLKTTTLETVCLLLPNITDEIYSHFYTCLFRFLNEKAFKTELYLSQDIPELENQILRKILAEKPVAAIIVTCQPEHPSAFDELRKNNINLIFFDRKCNTPANNIWFDHKNAIKTIMEDCFQHGKKHILLLTGNEIYSTEKDCIEAYEETCMEHNIPIDKDLIIRNNTTSQISFRNCMQNFYKKNKSCDVVITTSSIITDGYCRARQFSGQSAPFPLLYSLGDLAWKQTTTPDFLYISKSVSDAAREAVDLLLNNIKNAPFFDYRDICLPVNFYNFYTSVNKYTEKPTLRILILKGDMEQAIVALTPYLEQCLHIKIKTDAVAYENLYAAIYEHQNDSYYDVYFFDVPWLHDLAENGFLMDISANIDTSFMKKNGIEPRLFDTFAIHNQQIYALPFMYASQLLFYRKDLFDNYENQLQFRKEYGTDLTPPATWAEYNAIARFFTRKFHPHSQTEYGTTLGGQFSSAAHVEYLTRLWVHQSDIYDAYGNPQVNTQNAIRALENYAESFQYASPESVTHWWYEQIDEFINGKAAMMIMYGSHAAPLTSPEASKISGKFAFTSVPGKKITLGGWSVGINRNSRHANHAMKFITQICGKELSTPLSLLGCFSANHENFVSNQVSDIYPWNAYSIETFARNVNRILPKNKQHLSYKKAEQILAKAICSCITDHLPAKDVLEQANLDLSAYLNS